MTGGGASSDLSPPDGPARSMAEIVDVDFPYHPPTFLAVAEMAPRPVDFGSPLMEITDAMFVPPDAVVAAGVEAFCEMSFQSRPEEVVKRVWVAMLSEFLGLVK